MDIFFASRSRVEVTEAVMSRWMSVLNCGYYRNLTSSVHIARPEGRDDYQLIFVKSGTLRVNGKTLTDGNFFIYAPDEPQNYSYTAGDGTCYLWVHFAGREVPAIFTGLGLHPGSFHFNRRTDETETLFLLMCEAVRLRADNPDGYAASLLTAILHLLTAPDKSVPPLSEAARMLEDVRADVTVAGLAAQYRMSVGHFIHSFKQLYGRTPMNYRADRQFEQAKMLIRETGMSIAAAAELCGFTDPLYFSRQFKKHVGVSPTEYRRRNTPLSAEKSRGDA